jgi:hypothetical protein
MTHLGNYQIWRTPLWRFDLQRWPTLRLNSYRWVLFLGPYRISKRVI